MRTTVVAITKQTTETTIKTLTTTKLTTEIKKRKSKYTIEHKESITN